MNKSTHNFFDHKLSAPSYEAISDYAIIGDCHTAALISRTGSMDWLCLPDFSGPSLFAALLDANQGGRLRIQPDNISHIERRYCDRSAVLETTIECAHGTVVFNDFMAMPADVHTRQIIRRVECIKGTVDIAVQYQPVPNYARDKPILRAEGDNRWLLDLDHGAVVFESDMSLHWDDEARCIKGQFTLKQGEVNTVTLCYFTGQKKPSSLLAKSQQLREETIKWWNGWCDQCVYKGMYSNAVMRSCLTLKLLTHDTTGAIVAALTAGLPETFESGLRNWDYRYCWLRDTSLLAQSFLGMGFKSESQKFFKWLLSAGGQSHLLPLYSLNGDRVTDETVLDNLEGYRGLKPVHIGNSAHSQLQLDIYGEVLVTAKSYVSDGGKLTKKEQDLLISFGENVLDLWRKPDQGIWEVRGPPRHYTYSKMMCWVALNSLLALHKKKVITLDEQRYSEESDAIRHAIDTQGYNQELGSYVGYFGGTDADASLLLMLRYGYVEADDPRARGTYRYIFKQLAVDGLLFRYPQQGSYDGISVSENLFAVCNFWAVDFLARSGDIDEATELFERLLGLANDVGLYAEQFDVHSGDARGNFPQAFSHSGLVTAALALDEARAGQK